MVGNLLHSKLFVNEKHDPFGFLLPPAQMRTKLTGVKSRGEQSGYAESTAKHRQTTVPDHPPVSKRGNHVLSSM
jgi:hypothetical protein